MYGRKNHVRSVQRYSEGAAVWTSYVFLFDVSVCESVDDVERFEVILVMAC